MVNVFREALEKRRANLPPHTDAFRWSDEDVKGLVIDLFNDVAIINAYRPIDAAELRDVATALSDVRPLRAVYVKHRPKEAPEAPVIGINIDSLVAHEAGVAFAIRPSNGISVGLYVDSSQGRAWLKANARGRTVLNLFAYTCGFGINAQLGGAKRAVNVDASRKVLDWGEQNAVLNDLRVDRLDYIAGDAFDWVRRFAKKKETFDIVVADPPGFATTKTTRFSALTDYHRLAQACETVLAPGGTVLAMCNVEALTQSAFEAQLRRGAPSLKLTRMFNEGAVKCALLTR